MKHVSSGKSSRAAFWWALGLVPIAITLCIINVVHQLPRGFHLGSLARPSPDLVSVSIVYSLAPRMAMCLLCGAALAASGVVVQNLLRNPLAEPTTLGTSAGAQLALTVTALWWPNVLIAGTDVVALLGAGGATILVFAMSFDRQLSPERLILSGIVLSLTTGTVITVLSVFHGDDLGGIFIWATGAMNQNDWGSFNSLAPKIILCWFLLCALARPITVASLGDETARSLGIPIGLLRLTAFVPAVALGALVTSNVGVISFIGIAAPALARALGARRLFDQLIAAPLIGGLLLWVADQAVLSLSIFGWNIAAGSATSLIGAPILIWLLKSGSGFGVPQSQMVTTARASAARLYILLLGVTLALCAAMLISNDGHTWALDSWNDLGQIAELRWLRIVSAGSTGAALALAGLLMQRLTGNSMASPELVGVSSAASLGALAVLFLVWSPTRVETLAGAVAGATLALFFIAALAARRGVGSERLLLVGVAIASCTGAASSFLLGAGGPKVGQALGLLAGSTYRVSAFDAVGAFLVLTLGASATLLLRRWLAILPLGEAACVALGVPLRRARVFVVVLAGLLTGVATLIVGPLSFVGLLGPHLARQMGLSTLRGQMAGSAILGALVLVVADWLGRNVIFPSQIPAGLLSSLIGGPYLLWMMYRARRAG
jgi:ferric hydroxamate transport system permease protein